MITTQMIIDWKENPVTKKLLRVLKENREIQVKQLVLGFTLNKQTTVKDTSLAVGYIRCLDEIDALELKEEE